MTPRSRWEPRRPLRRRQGPRRRKRTVYLYVEGEATEPDYVDFLNQRLGQTSQFNLKIRQRGGNPRRLVDAAIAFQRLMHDDPDGPPVIWCIFDRDRHPDVDGVIRDAGAAGIRVAFSHPCFELWILLHFQDFSARQHGHGQVVKQRLQQANSAFRSFDKHLDPEHLAALANRYQDARRRAERLVDVCPAGCSRPQHSQHCQSSGRDPSTDVWRLVDYLGLTY